MSEETISAPGTETPVRPVGAWVVGGFLLSACMIMWVLVAIIFQARS